LEQRVFELRVADLPARKTDGAGQQYDFALQHDPITLTDDALPENYAHTLLVTTKRGLPVLGKKVTNPVKTYVRHWLSQRLKPVDLSSAMRSTARFWITAGSIVVLVGVIAFIVEGVPTSHEAETADADWSGSVVMPETPPTPIPPTPTPQAPAPSEVTVGRTADSESQDLVETLAVASYAARGKGDRKKQASSVDAWSRGLEFFRARDWYSARTAYQEALAHDPSYAPAMSSLGRVAAELGEWEASREAYEKALALDEDYVPALLGLATVHMLRRKVGGTRVDALQIANALIDRALVVQPKNSQATKMKLRIADLRETAATSESLADQ
jgi:tetratricopeptide (TPR) repeat protein